MTPGIIRLSSPILVYPKSAAVPLCTLQNSLNVLPSPMSSVDFSPLNLRSGVSSPITQKEKNSLFFLIVVGPAITT